MSDTLLRDLILLPDTVSRGDFVLNLDQGVRDAQGTLENYVVTPALTTHFGEALDLIKGALEQQKSRASYLDGSFGSGKSHFMAVLNFLLAGDVRARRIPQLASVVTKHDPWLSSGRFLMVPFHMIGAVSFESAILGGYDRYIREKMPHAATPMLFRASEWVKNAAEIRDKVGDEAFFGKLNQAAEEVEGWGALGAQWAGDSFDRALDAGPASDDYKRLAADLIATWFPSIRKEGEYVSLDEGLAEISKHAKSLGYHAVVFFLDELILWLASHANDPSFISKEIPKVSKLVESGHSNRPIPIISFIARQRDLRELIGEHVMGAQSLNFADQLKYWEGRLGQIKLEDTNLPFIAEHRVLKPRNSGAKQLIDEEFARTVTGKDHVMDILLTRSYKREDFRRLYPFSPALVETLVAVSSLLQRERTALKIMLQLLVEQKEVLRLGELVPVGDLYDQIAAGEEAFSSDMKRFFDMAHQLYRKGLRPMLEEMHQLSFEEAQKLDWRDVKRESLRNDDRLIKTLLLASLAPEVESLKALTPSRLAALNHGTIKSPIPGQEASIVRERLRQFAARCGQIKFSDSGNQPIISIQVSGVDLDGILERASDHDNPGNRLRLLKKKLFEALGVAQAEKLWIEHSITWRGSRRDCKLVFANVRECEDNILTNDEERWSIIIDYPIDLDQHGPHDDLVRIQEFRKKNRHSRTLLWIPSIFSQAATDQLGKLVKLEHILDEMRFPTFVTHLSQQDRETARSMLKNMRDILDSAMLLQLAEAYGLNPNPASPSIDSMRSLSGEEHFQSLDPALQLQVPASSSLRDALGEMLTQALDSQYPAHPFFSDEIRFTEGNLMKVLGVIQENLRSKEPRNLVEKTERKLVRQIVEPLKLGSMGETHFVIGEHWRDHFHRLAAKTNSIDEVKVREIRSWIDTPQPMGLMRILQDLILIVWAQQTHRVFMMHQSTVDPKLKDLEDDWVLRTIDLPDQDKWDKAVLLVHTVLGVPNLPAVPTGSNCSLFAERVKEGIKELIEPARRLETVLRNRAAAFGCEDADSAPRIVAAKESRRMLEIIFKEAPQSLVERLSELSFESPLEAMAASLKSAVSILARIEELNFKVIDAVVKQNGPSVAQVITLRDQVRQAFRENEYVAPLLESWGRANDLALQILTEAPRNQQERTIEAPAGVDQVVLPPPSRSLPAGGRRRKVRGDGMPAGISNRHEDHILRTIDVPGPEGSHAIQVTLNLAALIANDPDARYDPVSGALHLPAFDWVGSVEEA